MDYKYSTDKSTVHVNVHFKNVKKKKIKGSKQLTNHFHKLDLVFSLGIFFDYFELT